MNSEERERERDKRETGGKKNTIEDNEVSKEKQRKEPRIKVEKDVDRKLIHEEEGKRETL